MLVLQVEKVFLADSNPIIYCLNYIPNWVFESVLSVEQAVQPGATEPFWNSSSKPAASRLLIMLLR